MGVKESLEVLNVTCNGTEFRCEQWRESTCDARGESYKDTRRSAWLSQKGEELDDDTAMKLLCEKGKDNKKQDLLNRLWKED